MKRGLLVLALLAGALTAQSTAGRAQTDVTIPGGATGANAYCIQAGDLTSGAFVGTYLQTGPGAWEERLKAGAFKLTEQKRDDLTVELVDTARSAAVQFDFVGKVIKYKPAGAAGTWKDRYYILNATEKAASADCASLASLNVGPDSGAAGAGAPGAGAPGAGGPNNRGGGGGGNARPTNPMQMVTVPPKLVIVIPPGTQMTALKGPPCPSQPGFFLCPNKFTCAPIGGVCCPGAGSCNRGSFCDAFVPGNCVSLGEARVCPGSFDVASGTALHCPVGQTCINSNLCQ